MAFVYEHIFDTMGSMTRPIEEVRRALELHAEGVPTAEVARRTAIRRSTIRCWWTGVSLMKGVSAAPVSPARS